MTPHPIRRLLPMLPVAGAAALARRLASRTRRLPMLPEQAAALRGSRPWPTPPHARWRARQWGDTGPLIVLVHGWNGSAAQMAPLAQDLAQAGSRAVVLEVTGHGEAPGDRTGWRRFIDDLADLLRALPAAPDVLIGHSAGALTMMAARHIHGLRAPRCVAISAPTHPHPAETGVRQRLQPPPAVLAHYLAHIARDFDCTWDGLAAGRAWRAAGESLLLIHDEDDRMVPVADADRIRQWRADAQLVRTRQRGHLRILTAPETLETVRAFALAREPAPAPAPTVPLDLG